MNANEMLPMMFGNAHGQRNLCDVVSIDFSITSPKKLTNLVPLLIQKPMRLNVLFNKNGIENSKPLH